MLPESDFIFAKVAKNLAPFAVVDILKSIDDGLVSTLIYVAEDNVELELVAQVCDFYMVDYLVFPGSLMSKSILQRLYSIDMVTNQDDALGCKMCIITQEMLCKPILIHQHIMSLLLKINKGDNVGHRKVVDFLIDGGYERVDSIHANYEFSVIGDSIVINDGFVKYKLNYFSNEIESIYNCDNKKFMDSITIYPIKDVFIDNKSFSCRDTVMKYFDDYFIVLQGAVHESIPIMSEITNEALKVIVFTLMGSYQGYQQFSLGYNSVPNFFSIGKQAKKNPVLLLKQYYFDQKKPLLITVHSEYLALQLIKALNKVEIYPHQVLNIKQFTNVGVVVMPLKQGFSTKDWSLVTEYELLSHYSIIKKAKSTKKHGKGDYSFEIGDLVVHIDYGLGRFVGTQLIRASSIEYDCICLEYANKDKLFIPVEYMKLITYHSSANNIVTLDKLKSTTWQLRKARAKEKIKIIADQLIRTEAMRKLSKGVVCDNYGNNYNLFCQKFLYPLTDGQSSTIADITEDLASGRVMNRLVCGDTGFGKTEIALRTTFLALNAIKGAQVAVVAPTTLLCRQLHAVFSERFKGFPFVVGHLSSMVERNETNRVKNAVCDGSVHIVIGTHSIFNCQFKNLTLLIIDEEHNFGVKQKEKLKDLHNEMHMLLLSATPIPRTLHMSLNKVHDLSIIDTPPLERKKTSISLVQYNEELIQSAIELECNRKGQVFFILPRISDLEKYSELLNKIVPNLRIAMAHGKMPKSKLNDLFNKFYDQHYDVLLTTTIIESGIDIPNANTIIICNADWFGLSQLYQLKGRVGRSHYNSYAYFILSKNAKEESIERLYAIEGVESGMEVALRDMDIRGFGNLIGDEQAGHVKDIGIELYQQMLEEAMDTVPKCDMVKVDINVSKGIPDIYIQCFKTRMGVYNQLNNIKSNEDLHYIKQSLAESFGDLPCELVNLMNIVLLQYYCTSIGILHAKIYEKRIDFTVEEKTMMALLDHCVKFGLKFAITNNNVVSIESRVKGKTKVMDEAIELLSGYQNELWGG